MNPGGAVMERKPERDSKNLKPPVSYQRRERSRFFGKGLTVEVNTLGGSDNFVRSAAAPTVS
jgi:hypothetical protein